LKPLACDLAIASEDAQIGDHTQTYGFFGAGGSPYRLPLLVGMRKPKNLFLRANDFREGGRKNRIGESAVPADQLESAVDGWWSACRQKSCRNENF
jgi:enoyl-CoA hydratase/carnithine racemase